jgi:hypothetical protein
MPNTTKHTLMPFSQCGKTAEHTVCISSSDDLKDMNFTYTKEWAQHELQDSTLITKR